MPRDRTMSGDEPRKRRVHPIETTARIGSGPIATTEGVLTKAPSGKLEVPVEFRELDGAEGIALGFRQHMFDLKDDQGVGGEVSVGAGWGTDAIIMDWNDGKVKRRCVVRGLDLLRQWVATFDPEAVKRFPT